MKANQKHKPKPPKAQAVNPSSTQPIKIPDPSYEKHVREIAKFRAGAYYNDIVIGMDILFEAVEAGHPRGLEILRSFADAAIKAAGQCHSEVLEMVSPAE